MRLSERIEEQKELIEKSHQLAAEALADAQSYEDIATKQSDGRQRDLCMRASDVARRIGWMYQHYSDEAAMRHAQLTELRRLGACEMV